MIKPQVVLYVDEDGKEAITEAESAEEANARAKDMAQCGVNVLSVVDLDYGRQRVTLVRDTRVWYRQQGRQEDMFSPLMTYQHAAATGEDLREAGYEIVGLISQQQFLERTGNATEEHEEREDPNEPLRRAVERMEKTITRQEQARATVPDHHAESRRYQALELVLKLMEHKDYSTVVDSKRRPVTAEQLVKDAKVIEKYLKGTAPRRPSTD